MQIVVNNILINYEIIGDSNKPVIVILHGWRSGLIDWINIAKNISKDYRIILIDLPGFGLSNIPNKILNTYDYANIIKAFMQKLHLKNVTLIGHSFGGKISIIIAATTNLVEKLILISSSGIGSGYRNYRSLINIVSPLKNFVPKKILTIIRRTFGSKDFLKSNYMKDTFLRVIQDDLTHLLSNIKTRTFIIWGNKDKTLNVNLTKRFKRHIENSTVKIIWGAGHNPQIDKPTELVNTLKECLYAK